MGFSEATKVVLKRALPRDVIKEREGPGGMRFKYIPSAHVIKLLNEAFDFDWSSEVLRQEILEDTVVVLARLRANGVFHDAYGSAEIKRFSRGEKQGKPVDLGNAYKSAHSDAIKKAATKMNIGLELYADDLDLHDEPRQGATTSFKAPANTGSFPKPSAPRGNEGGNVRPPPQNNGNGFGFDAAAFMGNGNGSSTSTKGNHTGNTSTSTSVPAQKQPTTNPFRSNTPNGGGLPTTHLTALKNMATRKNMTPQQLITETLGSEIGALDFDQLNTNQAIEILRKAHSI